MNTRLRDLFGLGSDRQSKAGVWYFQKPLTVNYLVRNEPTVPELPPAKKRGVGITRKVRSQTKKARKVSKASRRRNR